MKTTIRNKAISYIRTDLKKFGSEKSPIPEFDNGFASGMVAMALFLEAITVKEYKELIIEVEQHFA